MDWRKWVRFSVWNFMWAVASVGIFCAVVKYMVLGKQIVSVVVSLAFGIPFVSGSLVGGFRGMCYGFLLGIALWILAVGVVMLLVAMDVDIGAI